MAELLNNENFILAIMGVVAFLITQGLKWAFVKPHTKNLDTRTKTIINSVILIIAFGSAVLCEFLYSHFWLHSALDLSRASYGWGYASGLYGVFETILKIIKNKDVKLENPYESQVGEDTAELIGNITKDKKVDKEDSQSIKEYLNKLNKVK